MKIAFIGQKGIPAHSGGIETHVEQIATRMADLGHEVFVYVRDHYTNKSLKRYKNVHLIHLPTITTKRLDAIVHTLLSSLDCLFGDYDVVHFHGIGPTSLSWIVKLFKRKTAVVATFHCQDYLHQKWGWDAQTYLKFGEYVTCHVPHRTITVSKVLADFAKDQYKKETIVIPNGAEVECTPEFDQLTRWNLKPKKYILCAGRLVKHKGVHYLIEAFKQLEDSSKLPNNFKLAIVGGGYHTDEYVEYLQTISEGRENIVFTDTQSGSALQQLFSHAYAFVQPSETEGMSIALLEAMAYGLCVVASDIPENKEPLGDSGVLFGSKNVIELRDKLAFLLNRPEEVQKFGILAKEAAQVNYGWNSIVQKILSVYKEVIEENR